jgi:hypothetical protein
MPSIRSISHLGSIRLIILATASFTSSIYGHPLSIYTKQEVGGEEEPSIDFGSPEFYEKMVVIMILVLVGGAFAGLDNEHSITFRLTDRDL